MEKWRGGRAEKQRRVKIEKFMEEEDSQETPEEANQRGTDPVLGMNVLKLRPYMHFLEKKTFGINGGELEGWARRRKACQTPDGPGRSPFPLHPAFHSDWEAFRTDFGYLILKVFGFGWDLRFLKRSQGRQSGGQPCLCRRPVGLTWKCLAEGRRLPLA